MVVQGSAGLVEVRQGSQGEASHGAAPHGAVR